MLTLVAAVLLGPAACGPSTPTASAPPGATPATPGPSASGLASPTAAASPSRTAVPSPAPSGPGTAGLDLGVVRVSPTVVVTGFENPLFVTTAGDDSGRLFVVEQGGRIRIVRGSSIEATPFLDLSARISAGSERGLLGLAFQPKYAASSNPLFFVDYTKPSGDTVVSSFGRSSGNPDVAAAGSERIRLTVAQPYANHNGGWIGFDPGGMLIVALGDGGSAGDPENRASRLDTLLGKLLRIDVLGAATGTPYKVPGSNPFVGQAGALPEILDYGLRNPFRDSFDPATGDLWIGDVGQDRWEEVDVARAGQAGLDFGWNRWEGRHCYSPPSGCNTAGVTAPAAEYSHADGCAVIGGVVYHGSAVPAMRGAYLFSDNCSGSLWAIDAARNGVQTPVLIASTGRAISSFGTDAHGEILLTDLGGTLLRLDPAS
jgi:glucose/arabinose dehydrogenase